MGVTAKAIFDPIKRLMNAKLISREQVLLAGKTSRVHTYLVTLTRFAGNHGSNECHKEKNDGGDDDEAEENDEDVDENERNKQLVMYSQIAIKVCHLLSIATEKVLREADIRRYVVALANTKSNKSVWTCIRKQLVENGIIMEVVGETIEADGRPSPVNCISLLRLPTSPKDFKLTLVDGQTKEAREGYALTPELPMNYQIWKIVHDSGSDGILKCNLRFPGITQRIVSKKVEYMTNRCNLLKTVASSVGKVRTFKLYSTSKLGPSNHFQINAEESAATSMAHTSGKEFTEHCATSTAEAHKHKSRMKTSKYYRRRQIIFDLIQQRKIAVISAVRRVVNTKEEQTHPGEGNADTKFIRKIVLDMESDDEAQLVVTRVKGLKVELVVKAGLQETHWKPMAQELTKDEILGRIPQPLGGHRGKEKLLDWVDSLDNQGSLITVPRMLTSNSTPHPSVVSEKHVEMMESDVEMVENVQKKNVAFGEEISDDTCQQVITDSYQDIFAADYGDDDDDDDQRGYVADEPVNEIRLERSIIISSDEHGLLNAPPDPLPLSSVLPSDPCKDPSPMTDTNIQLFPEPAQDMVQDVQHEPELQLQNIKDSSTVSQETIVSQVEETMVAQQEVIIVDQAEQETIVTQVEETLVSQVEETVVSQAVGEEETVVSQVEETVVAQEEEPIVAQQVEEPIVDQIEQAEIIVSQQVEEPIVDQVAEETIVTQQEETIVAQQEDGEEETIVAQQEETIVAQQEEIIVAQQEEEIIVSQVEEIIVDQQEQAEIVVSQQQQQQQQETIVSQETEDFMKVIKETICELEVILLSAGFDEIKSSSQIGFFELKSYLESIVHQHCLDRTTPSVYSLNNAVPALSALDTLIEHKVREIHELEEKMKLDKISAGVTESQQSRVWSFLHEFSLLVAQILRGSIVGDPGNHGQTLKQEKLSITVRWPGWDECWNLDGRTLLIQDWLEMDVPDAGLHLIGGAQFKRLLVEFEYVVHSLGISRATMSGVATALGMRATRSALMNAGK